MSVSNDETMVMINNTHRGFDLHSIPQQSTLHSFTEKSLALSATSVFVSSDKAVAYVSSKGAIRLWDISSQTVIFSVSIIGEFVVSIPQCIRI